MKPGIAFFDFDGTITTKDTLIEFIKFSKGTLAFYSGFAIHAPYLLAYKAGLMNNQKAKERILSHFFDSVSVQEFEHWCSNFSKKVLPLLIRPAAITEIKKMQASGIQTVIVSASPHYWISEWAREMNMEIIATELQITNGMLTGRIAGINCHGKEKVRRIKDKYQLDSFHKIYAYGDTKGDLPMLSLAHHSFMKPFR